MTAEARTCPKCKRAPLVERTNKASGHAFWGCSSWPDCDYVMEIPVDEIMRRLGAEPLPGFDL